MSNSNQADRVVKKVRAKVGEMEVNRVLKNEKIALVKFNQESAQGE